MGSEGHAGSREAAARGLPAPRAARWGSSFPQAAREGPTGRNLSKKKPQNAQIPARAAGKAAPGAALLGPGPLRARQTPRHPRRRPGPAPRPPRACGPGLRGVRPPARPHLSDRFEVQTALSAPHAQAAAPPPSAALRVSAARPAVSPWGGIGAAAAAQLGPRAAPCLHRFLGGGNVTERDFHPSHPAAWGGPGGWDPLPRVGDFCLGVLLCAAPPAPRPPWRPKAANRTPHPGLTLPSCCGPVGPPCGSVPADIWAAAWDGAAWDGAARDGAARPSLSQRPRGVSAGWGQFLGYPCLAARRVGTPRRCLDAYVGPCGDPKPLISVIFLPVPILLAQGEASGDGSLIPS